MGFGKDKKGEIIRENSSQAVGTLAAQTALLLGSALAITEDFRMLKAEVMADVISVTSLELQNLWLGLADGVLTLAEIEAAIENQGPLNRHDPTESAISMRPVWIYGVTQQGPAGVTEKGFTDAMTNARLIVAKPRWTFGQTTGWQWFLYNNGTAPTSGATVRIKTKVFGLFLD